MAGCITAASDASSPSRPRGRFDEFDAPGRVEAWIEWTQRRDLQAPRDAAGIWTRFDT